MGGKFNSNTQYSHKNNPSRKELRKQMRKDKKAKKDQYFKNKRKKTLIKASAVELIKEKGSSQITKNKTTDTNNVVLNKKEIKKSETSILDDQNKLHKQEMRAKAKLEKQIAKQRKLTLLEANKKEDLEIKKLEKNLRLNKRKSKSVPKSFIDEGLDYLLEVCDTNKLIDPSQAGINLQESESEFQDDLALITGGGKRKVNSKNEKAEKKKKVLNFQKTNSKDLSSDVDLDNSENELSESDGDYSDNEETTNTNEDYINKNIEEKESNCSTSEGGSEGDTKDDRDFEIDEEMGSDLLGNDLEDDDENEISDDEEEAEEIIKDKHSSTVKQNGEKHGVWEDIYGRLRDKQGNVVQAIDKGKYVPPHLRAKALGQDAKKTEELSRLKKQLKGLINRLAESNIHGIANQIDELYLRNSRNDMNDTLLSLITEVLVSPVLTADRLVMEHTLLITILHANIGMEIGAHFLEAFVLKFDTMYKQEQQVEDKTLDNVLLVISHLYNFKVFHAVLMYDILNLLCERFCEKEVELILLVLRSVGFSLRKDDPLALKNLVLRLQKKASEATLLRDNIRVRFMLDVLLAVKNNNMAKIPQYDPSLSEHLKKLLKRMIRKGKYVTELKVTLDDLLKVEQRGRWWIVGSAWTGGSISGAANSQDQAPVTQSSQYSQFILELARKQRMNTDTRRNIFCILMTAEDYLDAFEKLLRLGLKGQQERDIVHVMVHCLQQEKRYNPYYSHLATHFCQADRRYQMSIQYHLWDKFKVLSRMLESKITNLAKFIAHLVLEKALPISVLKVLQFSEMDKPCVRLLRQILLSLLLSDSEEALTAVFTRVSRPEKLHMFRESLRLFLHHFVLRNISDLPPDQALLLKRRVRLAETSLTSVDTSKFLY